MYLKVGRFVGDVITEPGRNRRSGRYPECDVNMGAEVKLGLSGSEGYIVDLQAGPEYLTPRKLCLQHPLVSVYGDDNGDLCLKSIRPLRVCDQFFSRLSR